MRCGQRTGFLTGSIALVYRMIWGCNVGITIVESILGHKGFVLEAQMFVVMNLIDPRWLWSPGAPSRFLEGPFSLPSILSFSIGARETGEDFCEDDGSGFAKTDRSIMYEEGAGFIIHGNRKFRCHDSFGWFNWSDGSPSMPAGRWFIMSIRSSSGPKPPPEAKWILLRNKWLNGAFSAFVVEEDTHRSLAFNLGNRSAMYTRWLSAANVAGNLMGILRPQWQLVSILAPLLISTLAAYFSTMSYDAPGREP